MRLSSTISIACLVLAWRLLSPPTCQAQAPTLLGVFPPGAARGGSTTWTIEGRNLADARTLIVSGDGVSVESFRPDPSGRSATATVRVADGATAGFREVRVDGPSGLSNLAIVRVDHLVQAVEVEPNDAPASAQEIAVGSAVAGTIDALDRDQFLVRGTPGSAVTLDWEARRLGSTIEPVMTASGVDGRGMGQARRTPGGDGDASMDVAIPLEGAFVVELRDNTYAGSPRARYRIRVSPGPIPSGLSPVGGAEGTAIDLCLGEPGAADAIVKRVDLPQTPGTWFDPGPFASKVGPVVARGRIWVAPASPDPRREPRLGPILPSVGASIDGRIGKADESDAYEIDAEAGDVIRVEVVARGAGSWLDPVVSIVGPGGKVAVEVDRAASPPPMIPVDSPGPSVTDDPRFDFRFPTRGRWKVEIRDRFDGGGPQYAYRLTIGPPLPDFAAYVPLTPPPGDPSADVRALGIDPRSGRADGPTVAARPGQFGVFNLRPGDSADLPIAILPRGFAGTVESRIEGLPEGVRAEPIATRVGSGRPGRIEGRDRGDRPEVATFDAIRIRVVPDAGPSASFLSVWSTSRPGPGGSPIERKARAVIGVDATGGFGPASSRSIDGFWLRVLTR